MIDVTGGGKIYGINRPINEIIINDKPWEELKDEAGYIKRFADFDGNKVDLKLGCKELDRDLYTGLIETTDGRKWIRKYSAPRPFFVPSGTDWIFLGTGTATANGSLPASAFSNWIRFRENVDVCVISFPEEWAYPYHNRYTIYYVSDHFVKYDTFTASTNGYTTAAHVYLTSTDVTPDSFGITLVSDPDDSSKQHFEYKVPSVTVHRSNADAVLYPSGSVNNIFRIYKYERVIHYICLCIELGIMVNSGFPNTPRILNASYKYKIPAGSNSPYNVNEFIDLLYRLYDSHTDDEILSTLSLMTR